MTTKVTTSRIAALRRRLLAWYRNHRRVLPWRAVDGQAPNPYRVLLSEAMLQQTQVATVVDYFNRFIAALPTVQALAAADEQQVLRLWQGLGYYRRARNLHAAAKLIVAEHGGQVPDTVDALLRLPGVGRYTSGAIASIAFNRRAPILDGNVARVLARWFAIDEAIDDAAVRDSLWSLAAELTPAKAPGDFNQAMMELGALVCSPRQPRCLLCPVAELCEANRQGRAESLPVRKSRRAAKAVRHVVAALEQGGWFLFVQRPAKGLWSNMWELPTVEDVEGDAMEDIAPPLATVSGVANDVLRKCKPLRVGEFNHQTTHRTITFTVLHCSLPRRLQIAGCWRTLDDLDDLPLSNPQRRVVAMLRK